MTDETQEQVGREGNQKTLKEKLINGAEIGMLFGPSIVALGIGVANGISEVPLEDLGFFSTQQGASGGGIAGLLYGIGKDETVKGGGLSVNYFPFGVFLGGVGACGCYNLGRGMGYLARGFF